MAYRDTLVRKRAFLWVAVWTIPLAYLATIAGWTVAEMGRQPWVIQDLLPTFAAVSQLDARMVQLTFWLFAAIFTTLAIAEVRIMVKQIKLGPKEGRK
jgi:cytochrome d ubiquinol oxidase subunit I